MAMYVTEDVTAVKRAELGQRLLAEAGRLLSSTLDLDASLQEVAELTIPALADWCAIDLPGPGGQLQLAALAHLEPDKVALAQRLRARHPVHVDDEGAVAGVIRDAARRCGWTTSTARPCARPPSTTSSFELLETLGLSALLVGAAALGRRACSARSRSSPRSRTGASTTPTRRSPRRSRSGSPTRCATRACCATAPRSRTCSRPGCGPSPSPVLPGCEVATVYRPAGEDVQAGGDFYDVIDTPAGSIVVMGDVVGKGAPAAALSARVARDAADGGAPDGRARARRWTSSTTRCAGAAR